VRNLLAFSRQAGARLAEEDLTPVVERCRMLLKHQAEMLGVTLEARTAPDLPKIVCDAAQVQQVVLALAMNALEATPSDGRVSIEASRDGDGVRLAIADTGWGIPKEHLDRIFEPFFTTKERGKGTGLGLSTVYGIVKQSGGEVTVSSMPGAGTEFRISFPCVEAPLDEAPAAPPAARPVPGSGTVILVEDEVAVRELIHSVLEVNGYRVLTARDPHDALRLGEGYAGSVDLLITDVIMPGMNGRDLAARITASRPGLRVLYISGYTEEILEGARLPGDGSAYLQKPFGLGALAAAVRDALA